MFAVSDHHRIRNTIFLAVIILIALGVFFAGTTAKRDFKRQPAVATTCSDRFGQHLADKTSQPRMTEFLKCADENARLFFERDYGETKDLAKAFLTLLTAVLVASITFSEKIVDLSRAGWQQRGLMILCWVLLLSAILSCGVGLSLMSTAAGWATYYPQTEYRTFEYQAVRLFIVAGMSFAGGLASLLAAGIFALMHRRSAPGSSPTGA